MSRRRLRSRAPAILVVLGVLTATALVAHGLPNFKATPASGSSGTAPLMTPSNVVISIRNITTVTRTITLAPSGVQSGCMGLTIRRMDGTAPGNEATLATHAQVQFVIATPGYMSSGTRMCDWTITSPGLGAETFTVNFMVDPATMVLIDPQPNDLAVGDALLISEFQDLLVTNYAATAQTFQVQIMGTGDLRFSGGACDQQVTCTTTVQPASNPPNHVPLKVRCMKAVGGVETGVVRYFVGSAGSGEVASHGYSCESKGSGSGDPTLDIVQPAIAIVGSAGTPATATTDVTGITNSLVSARITGSDADAFSFLTAGCGGLPQECMPTPPPALPTQLVIGCTPMTTARMATLTVNGQSGTSDVAPLTCAVDAPAIQVTPSTLDAGDVPVDTMSASLPLFLRNSGTGQLTGVVVTTGAPAWTVMGGMCSMATPCTIAQGVTLQLALRFLPTVHGRDDPTLTVQTANGGMATAGLLGNGIGSRLRVLVPDPPYLVDLGTASLDEQRSKTVKLYADGNLGLTVGITPPAAPFSVSAPSVTMGPMTEGSFDVRCQSATPLATVTNMLAIAPGSGAYDPDTTQFQIRCKVSNTRVRVSPSELDFGELHKGAPTKTIDVEITNPGPPVNLQFVRLDGTRPGLTLSAPAPQLLDTGAMLTATLALATNQEVVLEDIALEVGVEGADPLVSPITGKVVTASARVTPARLDLGTVCVGTPISGNVAMVNDGTATLRVQPPTMADPFAPLFVNPTTYPGDGAGVPLFPTEMAVAGITTAPSTRGKISGALTWDVDVPTAPFNVPVNVEYIDTGTAVSPGKLVFDPIDANTQSPQRTITLENCSEVPVIVTMRGVTASRGSALAWNITPSQFQDELLPHAKLRIVAQFQPDKAGTYAARLRVEIDLVDHFVELEGEALGVVPERKSLYGCGCHTTTPAQAWPCVLVLGGLLRRRRRR